MLGGGPAGAAAAITLARHGSAVLVVERRRGPARKPGEALSDGALPLLTRLGVADLLDAPAHPWFDRIESAWWGVRCKPLPRSGWLIDRPIFEAGLAAQAVADGVDWRDGVKVTTLSRRHDGWRLCLSDGSEAMVDRLVDATGPAAVLARRLGQRHWRADRLVGAWVELTPARAGSQGAICVFRGLDLWWYFAWLPGRVSAVAFGQRPPRYPAAWLEAAHAAGVRARLTATAGPSLHPAHAGYLDPPFGHGWLAVGDAAAAFDPLSGYGLTFALGSGYYGARASLDDWRGDPVALPAYAKLVARAVLDSQISRNYFYSLSTCQDRLND